MKSFRYLPLLAALTLLVGTLSLFAGAQGASAQVSRVAIVKELKGTVKIKKSGGSRAFNAFKNMSLNEGDSMTTGSGSSVVLELADSKAEKDSMTVGPGSQISFTKLEQDGGTKAKMNVWAGSMWVKVKSISNADDTFEVETPTAIMGVRGTHFYTSVDTDTGLTQVFVAAGVVAADTNPGNGNNTKAMQQSQDVQLVYPTQQVALADTGTGEIESSVATVDLGSVLETMPADIVQAALKDTQTIADENKTLAAKWSADVGGTGQTTGIQPPTLDQAALDRISQNMQNLMSNIAKTATDLNKISQEQLNQLVQQVNGAAGSTLLDPNNAKPLQVTSDEQAKIEAQKKLVEEAKKTADDKNKERAQQQAANAALTDVLKKKNADTVAKTQELEAQLKAKLSESFTSRLSAEQQAAFLLRQQQAEVQAAAAAAAANGATGNTGSGGGSVVYKPTVALTPDKAALTDPAIGSALNLKVYFDKFAANAKVFAYQVRVQYDGRFMFDSYSFERKRDSLDQLQTYRTQSPFKVEPSSDWTTTELGYTPQAVDRYFTEDVPGTTASNQKAVTYAVVTTPGNPGVSLDGKTLAVVLPFYYYGYDTAVGTYTLPFTVTDVMAVDKDGNIIASYKPGAQSGMTIGNASVSLTVTHPSQSNTD